MTIHHRKDVPKETEAKRIEDRAQRPQPSRQPNAKLAAALEEARQMKPRFKSAQELFDALDGEGQE